MVVLSNNDGCCIARSSEAKAMGIEMGTPLFQLPSPAGAKSLALFSSNYALYGDMSLRFQEVLSRFSPFLEVYSIDECFLELKGLPELRRPGGGERSGQEIRRAILREIRLPVSVGLGGTKTLAKAANRMAKKGMGEGNVFDLDSSSSHDSPLASLPVEDVWGVGPAYAALLRGNGIVNARQLRDADERWIRKKMGVVGLRTVYELRGEVCYELEKNPPVRRQIVVSRSSGSPVESLEELTEAAATYAAMAAAKLSRAGLFAKGLTCFLRTDPFRTEEPQYFNSLRISFPVPTDLVSSLVRAATEAVRSLYRPGYRYRKTGILLTPLVSRDEVQGDLFSPEEDSRQRKISELYHELNRSRGRGKIRYAVSGVKEGRWSTSFRMRSPRYTTRWEELPTIL